VVRLIFSEVLILNAAGAALGVAAAAALLPALLAIDPAATRALGAISIDWRVVAYAGLSALAASCLASLVPAMHAVDVSRTAPRLGAGARAHGSRSGHHTRAVLLVAQTALSLVLLAGGALLLRAVAASAALAPGYDPSNVLTAQVRLSPERHATAETRVAIVQRLLDRIREIPGVVSASTVLNDFRPGFSFVTLVDIEHQPTPDGSAHTVQFRRVSPGYFTTMRIREIQGRTFTDQDTEATLASAVVSRSFAARFWPGADPIGRRVQRAKRWHTVIGVVDDVSDVDLLQAPAPTIYVSWTQSNAAVSPVALVIRTAHDPASVAPAVRASVSALDPLMPVDRIQPLDVFLADSLAPQRFRATMLTALAVVGLLLGAIGIFGTTARTIAERWGELGVRLALGGERFALWRGAIAAQLKLVAIGVAVGALLAGVLGAALASLLPEVGVVDWIAVAGAAGALVVTAAVAAAVPALRILRLNPLEVLRG
jgi:putative ABC transport system permease protein